MKNWTMRGKCWKFGDNVGIDGDMMPLEFALKRETNPEVLGPYLMTGLDPDFPNKVKAGDIIVGGKRFAQGNPHIQGLIGISAQKLGLVVESIPRGSYRNAINAGIPFLPSCQDVTSLVETGDDIEVNFETGLFVNHSRGIQQQYTPLSPSQLAIIASGGWRAQLEARVAKMRGK